MLTLYYQIIHGNNNVAVQGVIPHQDQSHRPSDPVCNVVDR